MEEIELKNIIAENARRHTARLKPYNQFTGEGCYGLREFVDATSWGEGQACLPAAMLADPDYSPHIAASDYRLLRYRYDFEYWCHCCVKIKHKVTHRLVTFELNRAQRKLLATLESQRQSGKPVRVMLLKARQWGGSTLVQIYMAWWQIVLHTHCHSVICSHVKDASVTIKGMYATLIDNYPPGTTHQEC